MGGNTPGGKSLTLGGDIPFRVEVIEPTGSETYVAGRIGSAEVVGVFRERIMVRPGEEIGVGIDTGSTHLFDAGSGVRLSA